MSQPPPAGKRRSAFTLARELVGGVRTLVGLEIAQAKAEIAASLAHVKGGALMLGIALALGLAFLIALIAFIIAGLIALGLWWISLVLVILLALLAGFFGWRGVRVIRQVKPKPEQTIASVKEDIAWAKRLIKRG